jgi:hypothetical protein
MKLNAAIGAALETRDSNKPVSPIWKDDFLKADDVPWIFVELFLISSFVLFVSFVVKLYAFLRVPGVLRGKVVVFRRGLGVLGGEASSLLSPPSP